MKTITAVTMLSGLMGCATFTSPQYQTQSAHTDVAAHEDTLLAAAKRNAEMQGWQVVYLDKQHDIMVALAPEENEEGLVTRERWTFQVVKDEVTVEKTLEMQVGNHRWVSTREVCEGYLYVREQDQLARVMSLAQLDTQRQWAQAPQK